MAQKVLITGMSGLIGGVVRQELESEYELTALNRSDVPAVRTVRADLSDLDAIRPAFEGQDLVVNLAAKAGEQFSWEEFRETNVAGTYNVLEAARAASSPPAVIYSSTNKVYGEMSDIAIREDAGRYTYAELENGLPETRCLDFHSPYGCSKGAGDQYVMDYARIFELRTVVFRQSCIYGPHQFGIEDQGWLAWFAIRALTGQPVTIYGDGKQVRDVLYVTDLITAYEFRRHHPARHDLGLGA